MARPVDPKKLEAQEKGLKNYTGSPCKTCGNTNRAVTSGGCVFCNRERGRNYTNKNRQTIANAGANENKNKRADVTKILKEAQDLRFPGSLTFKHDKMS